MEILNRVISEETLEYWDDFIQIWGFVIAIAVFGLEIILTER